MWKQAKSTLLQPGNMAQPPRQVTWIDMQQEIKQFVKNVSDHDRIVNYPISARWKYVYVFVTQQELQSLSKDKQSKLSKMKEKHGLKDETMNLFKLKLYSWNVNDAIKYYKQDKFCLDYCIGKNYEYGCINNKCSYVHSIDLRDIIIGNDRKRDYKQGQLLCLYLMYKNVYNDNNPRLFDVYALVSCDTGKSQQDYLKSERYYLKALAIDNNYAPTHNNYGLLLEYRLHNYDKAEYHYNQALTINPNNAMLHANFAFFLISKRHKYDLALSHSEKACKLEPNLSWAHYTKAQSFSKLNKFDLSLKEYQTCLQLNETYGGLHSNRVKYAKEQIATLTIKTGKEMISEKTKNDDEKSDTNINLSKFDELSIIEGIDDIMAEIIQIEVIVDDNNLDKGLKNNIKQCLSVVQKKLTSVRTKCDVTDETKTGLSVKSERAQEKNSKCECNDLRLQVEKLKEEMQNNKKSTLSMLVEVKKIEQETHIQRQKIEVL